MQFKSKSLDISMLPGISIEPLWVKIMLEKHDKKEYSRNWTGFSFGSQ